MDAWQHDKVLDYTLALKMKLNKVKGTQMCVHVACVHCSVLECRRMLFAYNVCIFSACINKSAFCLCT